MHGDNLEQWWVLEVMFQWWVLEVMFWSISDIYGEKPIPEKSFGDRRLTQLLITMRQALLDLLPTTCFIQLTQGLRTFKPLCIQGPLSKEVLCVWFTKVVKEPSSPLSLLGIMLDAFS
jgi:hypothetical protein